MKVTKNQTLFKGLKYLKIYKCTNQYVAILQDEQGFKISKGYGDNEIDAINDLHHNFI